MSNFIFTIWSSSRTVGKKYEHKDGCADSNRSKQDFGEQQ